MKRDLPFDFYLFILLTLITKIMIKTIFDLEVFKLSHAVAMDIFFVAKSFP